MSKQNGNKRIITGVLTLLSILVQLNWMHDHTDYSDFALKTGVFGILLGIGISLLILGLIYKFATKPKRVLHTLSIILIPYYILILYPLHIRLPFIGGTNRYLLTAAILLSLLLAKIRFTKEYRKLKRRLSNVTDFIINERFAALAGLLFFVIVIIRTAWTSDDAFITYRVVENFVSGYGLRWNILERVQVFTSPLWTLLLSGLYYFTREIFLTTNILSIVLAFLTGAVLTLGIAKDKVGAVLGIILLGFSRAFTDYSTSGLENVLTFLLLVIFYKVFLDHSKKLLLLYFLGGLILLNRMDSLLLIIFPLILSLRQNLSGKTVTKGIIGFMPFILWELFSLFYYGFPFPNTAYAKLNVALPKGALLKKGLEYISHSFDYDPITPLIIGLGICSALLSKKKKGVSIGLCILLQVAYILKIGGDFMTGRFLAAPFLVAVILIIYYITPRLNNTQLMGFSLLLTLFVISVPYAPLKSTSEYTKGLDPSVPVSKERGIYYVFTGFLKNLNMPLYKHHPYYKSGLDYRNIANQPNGEYIYVNGNVGMLGFGAGPKVHIIDPFAVTDPLLSKITYRSTKIPLAGHIPRYVPEGYVKSVKTGKNLIKDPCIKKYYDKIRIITEGKLLTPKRLATIIEINTKQYEYLLKPNCTLE